MPALTNCPACGQSISTQAVQCPNCGHPMARGAAAARPRGKIGCLGVIVIAGAALYLIGKANEGPQSPPTPPSPCRSDWTKCADNADLANNSTEWSAVKAACRRSADEQARFGTPEWPWFAFGSFRKGDDYPKTGMVTAIEPEARFANGFGAMQHTQVVCTYDLRSKRVTDIRLLPQ